MRNPDARQAALEALLAAALPWYHSRGPATALQDVIRQHYTVLVDTDPGRTLAWPEQDHEPVLGVDYLPPADLEDWDRNWVEPTTTGGGHDGYPIAGTLTEARADCAACAAVGAAVKAEWIGWPNSVRIEAVRAA